MCGIVGIYASDGRFNKAVFSHIGSAIDLLRHRGPDQKRIVVLENCALAHARLSVIDLTEAASQPFTDDSGRLTIVYNGEIFNFPTIKLQLLEAGYTFRTNSDTEVLLYLYMQKGLSFFEDLNGFFAFAIYDNHTHELILARDRFGIKPLYYAVHDNIIYFASEWRSMHAITPSSVMNKEALALYLQLGYIPAPHSIRAGILKLDPGHFIQINSKGLVKKQYYQIQTNHSASDQKQDYEEACRELYDLVHDAVKLRLISDVPLGAFLSGGIDSSVIVAATTKFTKHLHTFSIGYKDHPYFDETHYAALVSKKLNTEHHVFSLSNDDLKEGMYDVLNHVDEPFADSSAIPLNILCREAKKTVTVVLSGDAADELFGGYNKHAAEYRVLHAGRQNEVMSALAPLLKKFPQSRESRMGNFFRQLVRYTDGLSMSASERYLRWASVVDASFSKAVLCDPLNTFTPINQLLGEVIGHFEKVHSMEDILLADMKLVLPNDMLYKVDSMSMHHALEVRVPFLDYRIVNFAFQLPDRFKIDSKRRKKILVDAFRKELPDELFNRPKKGFELPLRQLLIEEWPTLNMILNKDKIQSDGIFDYTVIQEVVKQLFSNRPGETHFKIWALLVFQSWYNRYTS